MFGDSLSLNELRKAYPELYHFMCKTESNFDDANLTEGQEEFTWSKMENYPKEEDPDVAQIFKTSDSVTSLLTIRKAMSSIFECLNTVHVQKTSKLRLEIRDLCCRLQGLQASREMDQREIYRLQRENDRYRRELSQQASRYEERITELHGVLAELKRKAAEIQAPTSIGNGTVGVVDDLAEFTDSESEADKANGVDGFVQSDLSVPLSPLQPTVSENVLEHLMYIHWDWSSRHLLDLLVSPLPATPTMHVFGRATNASASSVDTCHHD
ncbi:unnamed protein product [Mesocestoides corti]|uniref:Striatin domain-containing protein n=1 Tax=Mesocestoides corti TaxID=53468 RepID=A0A0R3ULC5_MESCO|nr:unnamed protein product [Mesocestoides corti]